NPSGSVSNNSSIQISLPYLAEEMMDLVQGENRRGRVVYCRRQSLEGNIHHDAKRKSGILFERAFLANGNRLTQCLGQERCAALIDSEQGVSGGYVIADLRNHFNDAVRSPGQVQESLLVESEHHAVCGVVNRGGRLAIRSAGGLRRCPCFE